MTNIPYICTMDIICRVCNLSKDESYFPKRNRKNVLGVITSHYDTRCKLCETTRRYIQKTNTPEKLAIYKQKSNERRKRSSYRNIIKEKNKVLLFRYGITYDELQELKVYHGYCCAICGVNEAELSKGLCVDHCHTTGKVRGLLCNNCNFSLGGFKDSIDNLHIAIKYLENYK